MNFFLDFFQRFFKKFQSTSFTMELLCFYRTSPCIFVVILNKLCTVFLRQSRIMLTTRLKFFSFLTMWEYRKGGTQGPERTLSPGPYENPESQEDPGPHRDSKIFDHLGKTLEFIKQVKFLEFVSSFTKYLHIMRKLQMKVDLFINSECR